MDIVLEEGRIGELAWQGGIGDLLDVADGVGRVVKAEALAAVLICRYLEAVERVVGGEGRIPACSRHSLGTANLAWAIRS